MTLKNRLSRISLKQYIRLETSPFCASEEYEGLVSSLTIHMHGHVGRFSN